MWSMGIVLCCVYLLRMTSCERDFKLLNVDRCSNGTIHGATNGATNQASLPFTTHFLDYCPEYRSSDYSDQINGLDFHINETFKNRLAGGCVTQFKTMISLPSNATFIHEMMLEIKFLSGDFNGMVECVLVNLTTPKSLINLPVDLELQLPCFNPIEENLMLNFKLWTNPITGQHGKQLIRKTYTAPKLDRHCKKRTTKVPINTTPQPLHNITSLLNITTQPFNTTNTPTTNITPTLRPSVPSLPLDANTNISASNNPKINHIKSHNNNNGTVQIIAVILAVGFILLLTLTLIGVSLSRKFTRNPINYDASICDTVIHSTCNHQNDSASQMCKCTVCGPSYTSQINSLLSGPVATTKNPGSTIAMKSDDTMISDNIYAHNNRYSDVIDSGFADSISC